MTVMEQGETMNNREQRAQIAAGTLKAANMADWLEGYLHRSFTVQADEMFMSGYITRGERIALSNGIGDALDAFHTRLQQDDLAALQSRKPYEQAPGNGSAQKDLSLDQQSEKIRDAWYARFRGDNGNDRVETWVNEVYEDYVIVSFEGAFYRIAYAESLNDGIEFATRDQWVAVERQWVEVGKALPAVAAVKALGADRIGGYAVLWGDSKSRDLTGEYFTAQTEELTSIFDAMKALPFLYHHAMDGAVKTAVVGKVDVLHRDEVGLWYEAQLAQSNKYKQAIMQLVEKGALGTSTGTLPGARKAMPNGFIARWPIVEVSGTPTPAEPRMMERPVAEIKAAYQALGLSLHIDSTGLSPQTDGSHPARGAEKARAGGDTEAVAAMKRMLLQDEMAWDLLDIETVGTQ